MKNTKRFLFIALALVVVGVGMIVPLPEGMPQPARAAIVDLLFLIVLWVGDVVPKPIASILAMLMLAWLGAVDSFAGAIQLFVSDVFFFLMAAFGIAAAVSNSPLPHRICSWFIKRFRHNTKGLLFGFMAVTALISTMISDLAACALFASIASPLLKRINKQDKNALCFAKCLMMGIPMAALSGGIMTPIGSPSNITLLSLLYQTSNVEISFLGWLIVGVPMGLLCLVLGWVFLCVIFKPQLSHDVAESFDLDVDREVAMNIQEKKLVVFLFGMFVFWVVQGVCGILSSTQVAVIGLIVLFLPGVNLLNWDNYEQQVPWDLLFMLGGVMAAGSALIQSGGLQWIVESLTSYSSGWHPLLFLAVVSLFIIIERAFVPMAPPVTIALSPIFMGIAMSIGLHPLCIALCVSIWCQVTYLFPVFDACWLITYSEGYYKVTEVAKWGWVLTLVILVCSLVLLPALSGLAALLP